MTTRRPRDRKDTIITAATELFVQRGYGAVRMEDIGAAVGISGAAIYRHFRNKEAILAEVLLRAAERLNLAFSLPDDGSDVDARGLIRQSATAVLDEPAPLALLVELPRLDPDTQLAIINRYAALGTTGDQVVRELNPDLDPETRTLRAQVVSQLATDVALGLFTPDIPRPRLDELLTTAVLGVLEGPAVPPAPLRPPAGWRPSTGRREEIVAAALRLFDERGFRAVGIDEIGEAAGIAGPTVYHYFESKSDILISAWERTAAQTVESFRRALAEAATADDALHRLATAYADVLIDNHVVVNVLYREPFDFPMSDLPWPRYATLRKEPWLAVLRELRLDLAEADLHWFAAAVFPLMERAGILAGGDGRLRNEIAAMAVNVVLA